MPNFEVAFGPVGEPPVEVHTVEAGNGHEALWKVMESFKEGLRSCDTASWDVTIRQLPDVPRT